MTNNASASSFRVLLFGVLKEIANSDHISVTTPLKTDAATVSDLLEWLAAQHPALAKYLPHVRVAVNREYVTSEYSVKEDDEIALLPPVAGGCIAL